MRLTQRCADLDRLDGCAEQAEQTVKAAARALAEARRAHDEEEIQHREAALLAARQAAQQARRAARQQGSGDPGDKPKFDSERGAVVDVYA